MIIGVAANSVLVHAFRLLPYLPIQLTPHLTVHYQFWRFVTAPVAFCSASEVMFGLMMAYNLRVVERHFGSVKFASMLLVSSVLVTCLEFGALLSGYQFGLNTIPAAPYGVLFAVLYQYCMIIPATYKYRMLGVTCTDKSPLYFIALQMVAMRGCQSLVASLCGILVGILYRNDFAGTRRFRFPGRLVSTASQVYANTIGPHMQRSARGRRGMAVTPVERESVVMDAIRRQFPSDTLQDYWQSLSGTPDVASVTPEQRNMLTAMFPNLTEDQITHALARNNHDVHRTVVHLLSSPPS